MIVKTKARVLSAESKPYKIDGNEGISHKVRLLIGNGIYPAKANESLVQRAQKASDKDVNVEVDFTSYKEQVGCTLVSIE